MFTSIKKHSKLLGDNWRLSCTRRSPSTGADTHNERTTSFEGPNRTLLIHGPVELKRGWRRQKRHLFLFSDLLLVSNTRYKKIFKVKNKIPLSTMWIADCVDEVGEGSHKATKSFVLGWPTVNFIASFRSSEQKDQWHSFLQRYINLAKEKDHLESSPSESSLRTSRTVPFL
ncbi:rho GTPase-activating protein 20-like [Dasypus novemcinctus]|uniref:rho GTPase-activating protein 20-like n=1 Tax=Dasypus novemcinctus TaxID=9361 RepID=UPI00265DCCBC|nr:rho GTPase-activating protein 20-like [Dasypus novemcinctus]